MRFLLFLCAESPVHAGADASVGDVDLPIQREAGSGLPVIWGQSLKGALRDHCARVWVENPDLVADVFGSPPPQAGGPNPKPGSLSVGDAQLVAFPVPTMDKTFAWVTSPLALARLRRKAALVGADLNLPGELPDVVEQAGSPGPPWTGKVVLGPYLVPVQQTEAAGQWANWLAGTALPSRDEHGYFRDKMAVDTVTVPDEVLNGIGAECVEVTPRVQLHDRSDPAKAKTVNHGPFQAEYLPVETLLGALLECTSGPHASSLRDALDGEVLRLGGNETIGKGLLWCRFAGART